MLTWSNDFHVDMVTGFLCCLGHRFSMLSWSLVFCVDMVKGFLC